MEEGEKQRRGRRKKDKRDLFRLACRNLLLACTFVLVVCATASAHPQLTPPEVIRLADAEARRHGCNYDPNHFKRSSPEYSARFHTWWVSYDPKPDESGRKAFTIDVDDKTKRAGIILP